MKLASLLISMILGTTLQLSSLNPVEGRECYQCTNIPNNDYYREGCDDESLKEDLLQECTSYIPNATIDRFQDMLGSLFNLTGREYKNMDLFNWILQETSWGFVCTKLSGKIDDEAYVIRGCAFAILPEEGDFCEDLDDNFHIIDKEVEDIRVCMCNIDGCNGGTTSKHLQKFTKNLMALSAISVTVVTNFLYF